MHTCTTPGIDAELVDELSKAFSYNGPFMTSFADADIDGPEAVSLDKLDTAFDNLEKEVVADVVSGNTGPGVGEGVLDGAVYSWDEFDKLEQVLFFYSKKAGKNSPHALVTDPKGVPNISALSNIAFEIFEYTFGGRFTSATQRTAFLSIPQFGFLSPRNFLMLLVKPLKKDGKNLHDLVLDPQDQDLFRSLQSSLSQIRKAVEELGEKNTENDEV
ncbi:hypothetical protein AN958_06939 [Leucoagaricus sp. SymC.cos]|nr:hypothetical protein AN958_06939 [Leucoagaricus sp. SymC.cos]